MAGFWKAMVNGKVREALAFFSQQIDPDEMAKITKTLGRDRDEILNDKDKGAALKDFTYYLYEFDGQKAKVVVFQEQGLPSSEITFIKENDGSWKIIELS